MALKERRSYVLTFPQLAHQISAPVAPWAVLGRKVAATRQAARDSRHDISGVVHIAIERGKVKSVHEMPETGNRATVLLKIGRDVLKLLV